MQVLNDLYRLGFIGNFLPASNSYYWEHRGSNRLIISEEWRMFIHFALHKALSLSSRNNFGLNVNTPPKKGDTSKAVVLRVTQHFAYVEFELFGKKHSGSIHVTEFAKLMDKFIKYLPENINVGEEVDVIVNDYDDSHQLWNLNINAFKKEL